MIHDKEASYLINHDYMEYSAETILYRAVADLRDGLKPSQRRILETMRANKVLQYTKSMDIVGSTMRLHPHGSTYPTIVNMVQEDGNNLPLILGQGNFGYHTVKEFAPAHDRYTEIKLAPIAIDNMVNMSQIHTRPSYDGRKQEPECLPVDFPLLFCHETSGLPVGFSIDIPSYNLIEICNATIDMIQGKPCPVLYPDFATKGKIKRDDENARRNMKMGTGVFTLRGSAIIEDNTIIITEIPYTKVAEDIITKILELMEKKKIEGIKDVLNTTDYTSGFSIHIFLKKGVDAEEVLEKLYAFTPLQDKYNSHIGYLYNNKLVYSGVELGLERWIDWKREAVSLSLQREKQEKEERIHLLKGIGFIYNYLDEAINIIRFSNNPIAQLMSRFPLDEAQATYINNLSISSYNVNKMDKLLKELKDKTDAIQKLADTLGNPKAIDEIIIKGLQTTIDKYGIPRNTVIEDFSTTKPKIQKVVEKYMVEIGITREGYVCKSKNDVETCLLKPGDEFIYKCLVRNTGELLIFGESQNCHKVSVDDIPLTQKNKMGVTFKELGVDKDNYLSYAYIDETITKIAMIYEEGRITILDADAFRTTTKRKKLSNSLANYTILGSISLKEDIDITILSDKGKEIKTLNTNEFMVKSTRSSQGVQVTKRIIKSYVC